MRKRLRILLFNLMTDVSDPVLGFSTSWINGLAARTEFVDVVTMERGELAVADNVRVFSVGKDLGHGEARRAARFYAILTRLLHEREYDAAFAHMMPLFAVMGAPILRIKRIPITLWYHHKSTPLLLRVAEKVVNQVVSGSAEGFRVPSQKLIVTGHGIDTSLFRPSDEVPSRFIISTVGRLAPIKNIEVLIDAAAELRQRLREFEVRVVGGAYDKDLAYERSLLERVRKLDLDDIVSFVGPVRWRETVDEYHRASVIVNLSDTGSLDKAGLEAMSCGVPIVTSNDAFRPLLQNIDPPLFLNERTGMAVASSCMTVASLDPVERQRLSNEIRTIVVANHSLDCLMDQLTQRILDGCADS